MSDQYHLSMKSISRKTGRSSTAAAAYRSGERIIDARTGEIHDYRRKRGVEHSHIVLPGGGTMPRAALWNSVEEKHKRGDAVLVREIEIALPVGLDAAQRKALVEQYAQELADRYGVAVDLAIHAPHPVTDADLERDPNQYYVEEVEVLDDGHEITRRHNGNWHAHVSMSACHFDAAGVPGKKCVELDQIHCQRAKIANAADVERPRWAELANAALEHAGRAERIDHRTLEAQGIARAPTKHDGPARTAIKRRLRAAVDAATHAVESVQAELASAVRDAAQAVAVAAATVPALAAAVEPPAAPQEARQAVAAPVAPQEAEAAPVAPAVPDAGALRRQAAELRKAALQADAQRNATAMLAAQFGDPRGYLVTLRRSLSDAQRERETIERQIQARSWIERVKARISDPQAERVAELRLAAQDIGRQIAETTALVPAADRAAEVARAEARAAKAAQAAVKTAEAGLQAAQAQAAQAQADRIARQAPGEREPERPSRPTS